MAVRQPAQGGGVSARRDAHGQPHGHRRCGGSVAGGPGPRGCLEHDQPPGPGGRHQGHAGAVRRQLARRDHRPAAGAVPEPGLAGREGQLAAGRARAGRDHGRRRPLCLRGVPHSGGGCQRPAAQRRGAPGLSAEGRQAQGLHGPRVRWLRRARSAGRRQRAAGAAGHRLRRHAVARRDDGAARRPAARAAGAAGPARGPGPRRDGLGHRPPPVLGEHPHVRDRGPDPGASHHLRAAKVLRAAEGRGKQVRRRRLL
mmetsp:Transcript_115406/g.321528  ORF Transcript_115406/g.321528 Transcript_115406/m.321528 type:complete len:256 (-) Transcript_115406:947-1714(-)